MPPLLAIVKGRGLTLDRKLRLLDGTALAAVAAAAPRRPGWRGQGALTAAGGARDTGAAAASGGEAAFHLVNALLGAGLLALPFVFRSTGLILGALLVTASALAARASLRLLLASGGAARAASLPAVAAAAFGPAGAGAARACVAVLNFAAVVACLNELAGAGGAALAAAGVAAVPRAALAAAAAAALAAAAAAAGARPRALTALSGASVGAAAGFAACLGGAAATAAPADRPPLALWRPAGLADAAPLTAFAFTCHAALFDVYRGLARRSLPSIAASVDAALAVAAAMYALAGAAGYATFGEATSGDVGANLGAAGGWGAAARACYCVSLVGGSPLVLRPLAAAVFGGGGGEDDGDDGPRHDDEDRHLDAERGGRASEGGGGRRPGAAARARTAALLAAATAAAVALPSTQAVLSLAGATGGVGAGCWLPAGCYLRLRGAGRPRPLSSAPVRGGGARRHYQPGDRRRAAAAVGLLLGGGGLAGAGVWGALK